MKKIIVELDLEDTVIKCDISSPLKHLGELIL